MTADPTIDPTLATVDADGDSIDWWARWRLGHLTAQRCDRCGNLWLPPMPSCPNCGAPASATLIPLSGRGAMYSWVVVHRALADSFAADVPYAVVSVDLEEGPRVLGRWLGDESELEPGARVESTPFVRDGITLLGFRPAAPHAKPSTASPL
jgi:uncharacterized OB-fold protein